MRITKIFKKNSEPERKFKVPLTWEQVTTKEYCEFVKILKPDENQTKVLEIFTGIPAKDWEAGKSREVDLAFGTLQFMLQPMPEGLLLNEFTDNPDGLKKYIPKEIWINEKPVQVPKDITNPAYAAREEIVIAISTHTGDIADLFAGIAATLLYEAYTKSKYESGKPELLIPYIEQVQAYQIIPIVYFFLKSPELKMRLGTKG